MRQGVLGTSRGEAIRLLLTAANRVLPHTRSWALRGSARGGGEEEGSRGGEKKKAGRKEGG